MILSFFFSPQNTKQVRPGVSPCLVPRCSGALYRVTSACCTSDSVGGYDPVQSSEESKVWKLNNLTKVRQLLRGRSTAHIQGWFPLPDFICPNSYTTKKVIVSTVSFPNRIHCLQCLKGRWVEGWIHALCFSLHRHPATPQLWHKQSSQAPSNPHQAPEGAQAWRQERTRRILLVQWIL